MKNMEIVKKKKGEGREYARKSEHIKINMIEIWSKYDRKASILNLIWSKSEHIKI